MKPKHVAMIMDGNGRWGLARGHGRIFGHRSAIPTVRSILEHSVRRGLECLSLFAFSTENWSRPQDEVGHLMNILHNFLVKEAELLSRHNIRLRWFGRQDRVPARVHHLLLEQVEATAGNTGLNLNIAIDYGARDEMTRAIRQICCSAASGELHWEAIDEDCVSRHLDSAGLPDVDLLIRTSGEVRISNFLLWQIAYAELYFTDVLWPDFSVDEFEKAIAYFSTKKRRMGGVDSQHE